MSIIRPPHKKPYTEDGLLAAASQIGTLTQDDIEKEVELLTRFVADVQKYESVGNDIVTKTSNQMSGIMAGYRSTAAWKAIAAEWGTHIANVEDYLAQLEKIRTDDLPKSRERYYEKLNHQSSGELVGVMQSIANERENIHDRIESINQVLAGTELRENTFLTLHAKLLPNEYNQQFMEKANRVFAMIASSDQDTRYRLLSEVIAILAKASDPATSGSLESQRLLDARHQFEFVAEERHKTTLEPLDFWSSSTGKSGGEKETFAGTIVAASLAYVLTPNGSSKPIYSTVIVDEALSNTSEDFSRRVLKTFRELGLHLNLITPFKNLNLARECASSLVLVIKEQNTSSTREITWEYVDQQHALMKWAERNRDSGDSVESD